jgi:hypothetical protein
VFNPFAPKGLPVAIGYKLKRRKKTLNNGFRYVISGGASLVWVWVWVDFAPEVKLTFVASVGKRLLMGVQKFFTLAGIAPEWFLPLLLFLILFNYVKE